MEITYKEFIISNDKTRINQTVVLEYLSRSYWANKRPHERTIKAIENSYCLGVYEGEQQIGFARVVSDYATFYYICDVFVLEDYRSKGIGKKLIEMIINSVEFEGLTGLLGTLDAHGLYEKYGFIKEPERFMKRPPNRTRYETKL